jgi:hypothetical protein
MKKLQKYTALLTTQRNIYLEMLCWLKQSYSVLAGCV